MHTSYHNIELIITLSSAFSFLFSLLFVPSSLDGVSEGIMFSGCSSAACIQSSVQADLVMTHEWLEQSQ